jgi:hypothetical protein
MASTSGSTNIRPKARTSSAHRGTGRNGDTYDKRESRGLAPSKREANSPERDYARAVTAATTACAVIPYSWNSFAAGADAPKPVNADNHTIGPTQRCQLIGCAASTATRRTPPAARSPDTPRIAREQLH